MEVKRKSCGVATTRTEGVKQTTLRSTQIVRGETKAKEIKSVGTICLWSHINSWVSVDVAGWSKGDGWIWSVEFLVWVTDLSPICHLPNREGILDAIFGIKTLVSLGPERRLDAQSKSASDVRSLIGKPVVGRDVVAHYSWEHIKAELRFGQFSLNAGSGYIDSG